MTNVTWAIMRIGATGSIVDNAHAGGCFVGIDNNGHFHHNVLNQYGEIYNNFNGIDFTSDYYPNWEQVTTFALDVCYKIIHHRLVALDIVLDNTGTPVLIEFNSIPGCYSPWLFQYTVGPAFGVFTDEILDYCKDIINDKPLYKLR